MQRQQFSLLSPHIIDLGILFLFCFFVSLSHRVIGLEKWASKENERHACSPFVIIISVPLHTTQRTDNFKRRNNCVFIYIFFFSRSSPRDEIEREKKKQKNKKKIYIFIVYEIRYERASIKANVRIP